MGKAYNYWIPKMQICFFSSWIICCIGVIFYASYNLSDLKKTIGNYEGPALDIIQFLESKHEPIFKNDLFGEEYKSNNDFQNALYEIRSLEGFVLVSESESWQEENLKQLHDELIKNRHGQEIESLYEIRVMSQSNNDVIADYNNSEYLWSLHIRFSSLPPDLCVSFRRNAGKIVIYNGDKYNTIEDVSIALSHEYGHHFTYFYMFENGNAINESEYVKIRKIPTDKILQYPYTKEEYAVKHQWDVAEIAAEDYVALMGSSTTRQSFEFYDIQQILEGKNNENEDKLHRAMNAHPQENLEIPYVSNVDGLDVYFYAFLGEAPPKQPRKIEIIELNITKKTNDFISDAYRKTFNTYNITWNMPYVQDALIYTLLCYDNTTGKTKPVKTVKTGEKGNAVLGSVYQELAGNVLCEFDFLDNGTKTLIVSVMFSDGTIHLSKPLVYTFNSRKGL